MNAVVIQCAKRTLAYFDSQPNTSSLLIHSLVDAHTVNIHFNIFIKSHFIIIQNSIYCLIISSAIYNSNTNNITTSANRDLVFGFRKVFATHIT